MIHLILAVFLIGLLLYAAALYESTALAALAFLLAGFVLSACALLIWRFLALEAGIEIPLTLCESDRPLGVQFRLHAKKHMLGKTQLRVQVAGRQLPGKKKKRTWFRLFAPSLGTETVRKEVTMHYAGGYEFRLLRVRIYDWTGWFYLTKRLNQAATVQLLPKVQVLPLQLSLALNNFYGEADVYDDLRGGTDPSQVFQIREYILGDRLQNIHWKLSAKSDEWMVREQSLPKGCPIVLLLGTHKSEKQTPEQQDHFLQIVAALSFALVDAQCPHIVSWYDDMERDLVRMRVDDDESFYEWQLRYLTSRQSRADVDVEARYRQKYRSEPCLHRLRVEPALKLYLDDSLFHSFAKKGSLKEEIEGLHLCL